MKREIKFRAWDGSQMLTICRLGLRGFSHETWSSSPVSNKIHSNDSLELMQFTGLKDKNGKEIYEGDVLSLDYPIKDAFGDDNSSIRIKVFIEFQGGSFWFSGEGYTDCNWHFYNEIDREIIGNIYENPELL